MNTNEYKWKQANKKSGCNTLRPKFHQNQVSSNLPSIDATFPVVSVELPSNIKTTYDDKNSDTVKTSYTCIFRVILANTVTNSALWSAMRSALWLWPMMVRWRSNWQAMQGLDHPGGSSDVGCMSILPHHWVPLKAPRTTPLERKAPALCADRYWQEICPSSPGFDLSPIRSTVTRNKIQTKFSYIILLNKWMEGSLRVIKATEGLQTAPNRFNYDMSLVSMNANTVCVCVCQVLLKLHGCAWTLKPTSPGRRVLCPWPANQQVKMFWCTNAHCELQKSQSL